MTEQNPEPVAAPIATKKKSELLETVRFVVVAVAFVFIIRTFIAQPFIVSGDSMIPTFHNGEYLIVDELSYRFSEPKRHDTIILHYPLEPQKYFIKRIVGLPGETVQFEGARIRITPTDGSEPFMLDEPFVKNQSSDFLTVTLGPDEYYVLGDNRSASSDSRRWGPLPRTDIVGKPIVRLFPISRIDWRPGMELVPINATLTE